MRTFRLVAAVFAIVAVLFITSAPAHADEPAPVPDASPTTDAPGVETLVPETPAHETTVPADPPLPIGQPVSALSVTLPERVVSQQPAVITVTGVDIALEPGAPAYVEYAPLGAKVRRDYQVVGDDGTLTFAIRLWKSGPIEVVYADLRVTAEVPVQPAKKPLHDPSDAPKQRESYQQNPDPPALGDGANQTVVRLTRARIASMTGLSWRPGCVPLSSLREVRVNYWGADGYRHRGVLIARDYVAHRVASALGALYASGARIQSMHPVDRYGKNPRGPGADDYASMAAGNTSMFNCRYVVGKEASRTVSPHSSGTALDLNPWHNPYVARTGVFPNSWWLGHGGSMLKHSSSSAVVRTLARYGCSWGASYRDFHHFDCRG